MKRIKLLPFLFNAVVGLVAVGAIYVNAESISNLLPDFLGKFEQIPVVPIDGRYENLLGLITLVLGAIVPSGVYGWFRRVRTTGRVEMGQYFEKPEYTNFPAGRMGYSDRLSYTLAELSDLAYWDVFDKSELDDLKTLAEIDDMERLANIKKLAESFLASKRQTTPGEFDKALSSGGFKAIERVIRSDNTQCLVCVHKGFDRDDQDHQAYIVVAFRGSERNIDDWLTNADAIPASEFTSGRVHQGFYKAYMSVQEKVIDAIKKGKAEYDEDIPVFFTGHSLGGALAVVATRLNAPDTIGACYTYGCPRVGGYDFFKGLKTPVYRVVNSSDLVPRVPPGIWSYLVLHLLSVLAFVSARWDSVSGLFEAIKGFVDKINYYRHHGDLRFLPDIPSANIDDRSKELRELQVLANPNQFDMIQWFFRHVLVSFGMPVKSHSMKLYRNKLLRVAVTRMQPLSNSRISA